MYCCSWSCFSLVHLRITANLLKLDWRKLELCWPIRVFLQNIKSRTQNQSKYIGGVAYDEEEKGRGSFLDEGCSSNIVNKKIVHNFFFCFFFNIKCLFPILSLFVLFLPLPFVNFFFEFDDWKKKRRKLRQIETRTFLWQNVNNHCLDFQEKASLSLLLNSKETSWK